MRCAGRATIAALFLAGATAVCPASLVAAQSSRAADSGPLLQRVEWSRISYPVTCFELPTLVNGVEYEALPSHTPAAIVLVTCNAADGAGEGTLFVFDDATSTTQVHLLQTLLRTADGWVPGTVHKPFSRRAPYFLTVSPKAIELQVAGYRGNAPRCCANVFTTLVWKWDGRRYVERSTEPHHNTA